jgi:hypothetical protein
MIRKAIPKRKTITILSNPLSLSLDPMTKLPFTVEMGVAGALGSRVISMPLELSTLINPVTQSLVSLKCGLSSRKTTIPEALVYLS